MLESREPPNGVVDLPSAGVPSDHGLASLGLMMQLAGRVSGGLVALVASIVVLESRPHRHAGWFFLGVALCIARSQLHRLAGHDLAYGRRTIDGEVADPLRATRRYAAFGIAQALAIGLIAGAELGATTRSAAGVTAALALWPAVLTVVLHLPRFRPFRAGIPLSEDRGLEGASIVMTTLGACGVASTGAVVLLLSALPSRHLQHGWGAMLVVVFALLLVRSCLHVTAGVAGLREISFDRPGELATRYASFGVISVFCVGAVLSLLAMSERLAPEAIVSVVVVCWLLAAWPLIVKRYFSHRQFAELLAGDRMIHRRAPDGGLTGLGWLLVADATAVAAATILEVTVQHPGVGRSLANLMWLGSPIVVRSPTDLVLAATVVGLELIAAASLLRMSSHRRVISTIYALVGGCLALATAWPFVRAAGRTFDLRLVIRLIPMAIQIVIPAATLVLVGRSLVPAAQAHYRTCAGSGEPGRSR